MVETDLAFVSIDIPQADVTVYTRSVSFAFSDKISGLGEIINNCNQVNESLVVPLINLPLLDLLVLVGLLVKAFKEYYIL